MYLVNDGTHHYSSDNNMSQHSIPSTDNVSYWQEYHTIIINTPIPGPTPTTTSDGEAHPPFREPSFIQTPSPISVPPSIPSPVNLRHQEELFKQLQELLKGYLTSTTNSKQHLIPIPQIKLPPIEHVEMDELHNITNHLDWQQNFTEALNFMGDNHVLLSTWWYFDYIINTTSQLEKEAAIQWDTTKNLFEWLKLLKVNDILWPLIVKEWKWEYWRINGFPSQLTSPTTTSLIMLTSFDDSFKTAPSTPGRPGNPAPPNTTTKSINMADLPTTFAMLQVPTFNSQRHGEPIYVAGSSSEDDSLPRTSVQSARITRHQWETQMPYQREGHQLWQMRVRAPFGGTPSTSDLESLI